MSLVFAFLLVERPLLMNPFDISIAQRAVFTANGMRVV